MHDDVSHLCHTALLKVARPAGLALARDSHREARHELETAGQRRRDVLPER